MAVLLEFLVTVLLEYIDLLSVSIYLKSVFSALAPYLPFTGADPEFGKGGYTSTLLKKVADQTLSIQIIPIYNCTDKLHCLMHFDRFITDCSIRVYRLSKIMEQYTYL